MEKNKVILLKQNSKEIRHEIRRYGIGVCKCAEYVDSCWLDYYPSVGDVHGVGYAAEGMTAEETIAQVEYEWKEYNTEVVECEDVHEFICEILKTMEQKETKLTDNEISEVARMQQKIDAYECIFKTLSVIIMSGKNLNCLITTDVPVQKEINKVWRFVIEQKGL